MSDLVRAPNCFSHTKAQICCFYDCTGWFVSDLVRTPNCFSHTNSSICFSYQPAPFFVLDEIDAALDNTNIGKVSFHLHIFIAFALL